jgi:broad specificity phosphatase PhoE
MRVSREVGKQLGNVRNAAPFDVIVSSPYLRCAESASEIARELRLPVIFDDDLGEVGENVSKTFDPNSPPHRERSELLRYLYKEYPDVEYAMAGDHLQIHGGYPMFPESLSQARTRFAKKAQHICQSAAASLRSVIIVTHADALDAIVGAMKRSWVLTEVPSGAFFVAERQVRVMEKRARGSQRLTEELVFGTQAPMWTVELCPSIKSARRPEMASTRMEELRRRTGKLERNVFDLENYSFSSKVARQKLDRLDTETTASTFSGCSSLEFGLGGSDSKMSLCEEGICEESSNGTL